MTFLKHMNPSRLVSLGVLAALPGVAMADKVLNLTQGATPYARFGDLPDGHQKDIWVGILERCRQILGDHFLVVVNAANVVKDYTWIADRVAAFGDAVPAADKPKRGKKKEAAGAGAGGGGAKRRGGPRNRAPCRWRTPARARSAPPCRRRRK